MLISADKLLAIKLFQIVISAQIDAVTQDYKIEVPNINIRFWQTPLRESVYQSIARHRVYRGENLDERQEYDRMLWGKIRIARFMKRLDVAEANEGLRTGVLVNGKRGDYEFRQTDHSIYDCVGRKCRSDNVLLAVWRVQQMNEPYTLYISVKVPNSLYHFEPTEDIYLFTVEKGLKRLRYQQNSTKKSTGKLIYDPYPFVSSRFTTQSTPLYSTIPIGLTTPLEVITVGTSPEVEVIPNTHKNTDRKLRNEQNLDEREHLKNNQRGTDETKGYTFDFFQNPTELTTSTPLQYEPDQVSLTDYSKGSGIRRTFNTFVDTNPFWELDLISPPSQYRNYSDERKQVSVSNFNIPRDTVFTPNQPREVLITPKPFKPSPQYYTYSEPDPLYSNTQGEKSRYTTERPIVILNPQESKKEENKYPESLPFGVEDAKISLENEAKKLTTLAPKISESQNTSPRNKWTARRGNFSTRKTKIQVKKNTRVRSNKLEKEKISNITATNNNRKSSRLENYEPELKNRFLSPTTYHPKLNLLVQSESKQLYSHLLLGNREFTPQSEDRLKLRDIEKDVRNSTLPKKAGKIHKRQENEGYFSNGHQDGQNPDTGYDDIWTHHPSEYQTTQSNFLINYDQHNENYQWTQRPNEYETTQQDFSANYEGYNENYQDGSSSSSVTENQDTYGTENPNYFHGTQELQEFYTTENAGYDATDYTTYSPDYTEVATENINYAESQNSESQNTGTDNWQAESMKREATIKDVSVHGNTVSLKRKDTKKKIEEAEKNSEGQLRSVADDTIARAENSDQESSEKNIVWVRNETSSHQYENNTGQKIDTDCQFCDGKRVAFPINNSTISVIVSRLIKSITERMQDGTEAVHKINAPIYRKKILKKLKNKMPDKAA